jgi:hypothetical protein
MLDQSSFKWLVRGFVVTSLVLSAVLLIVRPPAGWAQGGDEDKGPVSTPIIDEPLDEPGTDDPEGQLPVVALSSGTSDKNPEWRHVPDDNPPHDPGTDEPAGGAASTGVAGAAGGVVGQAFGGRPPLVIPAAAFTSHGDNVEDYFFSSQVSGFFGYIRQDGTASVCLQAPAYLPVGATVTSVYGYLYDNHSSGDAWVDLYRVGNMTGAEDTMASVSTTGYANSSSIRYLGDTTITQPVVSDLYSYYVFTCFPSNGAIDLRLYAVRIFYE